MRAGCGLLLGALAGLTGCFLSEEDGPLRQVDMAARSLWPVSVSSDCEQWPLCRELPEGRVLDVSVGAPSVLETREATADGFTLVGRDEGESRLSVRAGLAAEEERTEAVLVRTWTPTGMWLSPICTRVARLERVYLPPVAEVTFLWQLEADGVGNLPGYAPFEAGALEEVALDMVGRLITWRTPAATGAIEIRSSAFDGLLRTVEVYDDSLVDGLDVSAGSSRPIEVGRSGRLTAVPLVGATDTCQDRFERAIELTTPEVCSLSRDLDAWSATSAEATFMVYGRSPGLCSVTVALVGTEISATLELRVVEAD